MLPAWKLRSVHDSEKKLQVRGVQNLSREKLGNRIPEELLLRKHRCGTGETLEPHDYFSNVR